MATYIYDRDGWRAFAWDEAVIAARLAAVSRRQGRLIGRMESLGFELKSEAILTTLTDDVMKSSEIEGEQLDKDQVRSSIARRLGLDIGALTHADRHVEGVVEMMLDATQNYAEPLNEARLFAWHSSLFPTGRSGMRTITVGSYRSDSDGPMQVVSGPVSRERVHYEAPPANRVAKEMSSFLTWLEGNTQTDLVLKSALAHFWFVTIHPFDDGNGRIARAIADMLLARSEGSSQRFYSMSSQIRAERTAYYDILEATQKSELDITRWLTWYFDCLDRAITRAENVLAGVLVKARFWDRIKTISINDRQRAVLNRLLDGFEGKLNTSKWAKLTNVSNDTALRDIVDLIDKGILMKEQSGGRSTSYAIAAVEAAD